MPWKDLGIIALIVGILGILWYIGILKYEGFKESEGFVARPLASLAETGFLKDDQIAREEGKLGTHFEDRTNFYHNATSSEAIYASSGIISAIQDFGKKLTSAFEQKGFPDKDFGAYVRPTVPDTLSVEFEGCANLRTVDEWIASTSDKCGWMVLADGAQPRESLAILGTAEGPHEKISFGPQFPAANQRTWYWITQKTEAKRAEEEKECKRITVCGGLDVTKNCAFNVREGRGVYYNRAVTNAANSDIITSPGNCPTTMAFCVGATTAADRRACIKQILGFEGIPTKAWIYVTVDTGVLSPTFVRIREAVYERAKTSADLILVDADLTGAVAVSITTVDPMRKKLQYLKRLATSYDSFLADLAQMLVYGELLDGREFVLESYYFDAASKGNIVGNPDHAMLAVDILQKEWRKAGCQVAGSDYPTRVRAGALVDIQKEYRDLRSRAQFSESPQIQQDAIRRCMNSAVSIGVLDELGDFCNERGIEYFLYDGEGDMAVLIGHVYSMEGLLTDDGKTIKAGKMRDTLNSATLYPTVSYNARTMISTATPITMTPHPTWINRTAYTIKINKDATSNTLVTFTANRRNLFEMEYSGLKSANWGKPKYSFIDLNLDMFQLFQSAKKPFVSFNFYFGNMMDSNRLVDLDTISGLQFGKGEGMNQGIIGSNRVKLNRRIRNDLMKIISQRVRIPSVSSGNRCTLFVLENTTSYTETCEVVGNQIIYTVRNGFEPAKSFTFDVSGFAVYDNWVNIAVEYIRNPTINEQRYIVYVNQTPMKMRDTSDTFKITNETFKRPMDVYVVNPGFTGEMAWFHIYDMGNRGRVEGFQNPTTDVGGNILDQEAAFDPQKTEYSAKRAIAKFGDFLVSNIQKSDLTNYSFPKAPSSVSAPASVPVLTPTSAPAGTCPFDPITYKTQSGTNPNYVPGIYREQGFQTAISPREQENIKTTRECENICNQQQCQAYTFNSERQTCKTYSDLGTTLTTVPEKSAISSILKERKPIEYDELKALTLKAIAEFKEIRKYLKSQDGQRIYDQVFRTRTGFGLFDRTMSVTPTSTTTALSDFKGIVPMDDPRTDAEIDRDEKSVESNMYMNNLDCLNGIYQKYRIE